MIQVQGTSINTVMTLGLTTLRLHCPILYDKKIKMFTAQNTDLWKTRASETNYVKKFCNNKMGSKHNESLLLNTNFSSPHPSFPHTPFQDEIIFPEV